MAGAVVLAEQDTLLRERLRQVRRLRSRAEGGVESLVLEHDHEDVPDGRTMLAAIPAMFEAAGASSVCSNVRCDAPAKDNEAQHDSENPARERGHNGEKVMVAHRGGATTW